MTPLVEMLLALRALRSESRRARRRARGAARDRRASRGGGGGHRGGAHEGAAARDRGARGRRPRHTGRDVRRDRVDLERGPLGRRARGRHARDAGGMGLRDGERASRGRSGRGARGGCASPSRSRAAARVSQPYWRRMPDRDRHELLVPADETLPWSPPDVVARIACRIGGAELTLRAPAVFRYAGSSVGGEKRHVVTVVPELAVRVSPEIAAVPTGGTRRPIEVHAFVRNEKAGGGEATVRLEAPRGWSVRPAERAAALRLRGRGDRRALRGDPPCDPRAGRARASSRGRASGPRVPRDRAGRRVPARRAPPARAAGRDPSRRPRRADGARRRGRLRDGLRRRDRRRDPRPGRAADAALGRRPRLRRPVALLDDRDRDPRLRDAPRSALLPRPAHALGRDGRAPRRPVQP